MADHEAIVIGGGISGLSFAHAAAAAGRRVLLLEKSAQLGGCVHSERHGDYWLEMGAHTCYNSYDGVIEMIESCGIGDRITPRARVPFRLLRDGELRSIPGELSFLEVALSLPRILGTKKTAHSVESYYSRLAGARNYRRVLAPMFAAVPSQNADGFPATMLFKKRPRRRDILRSFTLDGGLQLLIDSVAQQSGIETMAGVEASRVERDGSAFAVHTSDGRRLATPTLALAIPPPRAAKLLAGDFPDLAQPLQQIRTSTVESVGVVIPAGRLEIPPVAGIIARGDLFFSAVSRDTVPDEHYRSFTFHMRPGSSEADHMQRITEVLGVERDEIERVVNRRVVLPSPALGHEDITREIDRLTAGTRLSICGNFFAGLAMEDCVSRSFEEVVRLDGAAS